MLEKTLFWTPRVLAILAIAFMFLFSFDSFSGNETFIRKTGGFLIHNIPVLILTVLLIVAWKSELAGGLLFCVSFLVAAIFFDSFTGNPASLIVITPFLLTGVLFLVHHILFKSPVKRQE